MTYSAKDAGELVEAIRNGYALPSDDAIALAMHYIDALEELAMVQDDLTRSAETGNAPRPRLPSPSGSVSG